MIVFVHIPKTGGTSIRKAAAAYFSDENVLYDYGATAPLTSPLVRELLYEKDDIEGLASQMLKSNIEFLSGHFKRERYHSVLPHATFITWVRDPVDRVLSLHRHRTKTHPNTPDLEEFSRTLAFRNGIVEQAGSEPDRYAFIGVLERHDESVARLNEIMGLDIAIRHDNAAIESHEHRPSALAEDTGREHRPIESRILTKVKNLNGKDDAFVAAANARLSQRPVADEPKPDATRRLD